MEAALARAAERGFRGTRLLQAAFHNRSLSLYTKLGFDTREPISAMQGPPISWRLRGIVCVRHACRIWKNATGFAYPYMVTIAAENWAMRFNKGQRLWPSETGELCIFHTGRFFRTHGRRDQLWCPGADRECGCLSGARDFSDAECGLFRWCLVNGLRVVQPLTLMTLGFYKEPAGAYLPSILY